MPRQDATSPLGYGPKTGWGFGPCGMGFAFGRGYGRGYGRWVYQPISKKEEKEMLEDELAFLENEVKAVKERISKL